MVLSQNTNMGIQASGHGLMETTEGPSGPFRLFEDIVGERYVLLHLEIPLPGVYHPAGVLLPVR